MAARKHRAIAARSSGSVGPGVQIAGFALLGGAIGALLAPRRGIDGEPSSAVGGALLGALCGVSGGLFYQATRVKKANLAF